MTHPHPLQPCRSGMRALAVLASLFVAACSEPNVTFVDPVVPPPPAVIAKGVKLNLDTTQLAVGDTTQLTATVTDSRGAVNASIPVTWSSSDPTVLSSAGGGRFVAVTPGLAVVVATASGVSATARVRVEDVVTRAGVVRADTVFTVLSDSAEIASGTLRLRGSGATGRPVAVGDVVFGTQDGGFLEKVTAVRTSGQDVILQVTPAALTDAISRGSITISEDVDVAAALRSARARGDSAVLALPRGISIDPAGRIVFDNHDLIFESKGSISGLTASVRLNGTLGVKTGKEIKPGTKSFTFDVEIEPCFPSLVCVDHMEFGTVVGLVMDGELEASIGGAIGGRVGLPLRKIQMGRKRLLNVPIRGDCLYKKMFCYGLFAVVEAYAEVEASAQVTVTRKMNMTAGVDAGFTWTEARGFRGTFNPINRWTQQDPTYEISGGAGLRIGLEPKLLMTVFGRGELSAGVDAAVLTTLRTGSDLAWNAQILALIDAFARAEVNVLGIKAQYEPARLRLWDTVLESAKGNLATVSLSPSTLTLEEGRTGSLAAVGRTVLGGVDLGLAPSDFDWVVTPASVATVSSAGEVTAVAKGTAKVTATIKGTSISKEATLTVTARSLTLQACYSPGFLTSDQPLPSQCNTATTPQLARGETARSFWVRVTQSDGTTVTGATFSVRDPFTGAAIPSQGLAGPYQVYRLDIPAAQTLGVTNVVVGPASAAGFTNASAVNVPIEVVRGILLLGSCLSKDASLPFNGAVHCLTNAPSGSAGQTYYLWFGADFPSGTARCGATVTVSTNFTGTTVPTNHVVPLGAPGCLARIAIPVPPGTPAGTYEVKVGPARLVEYGASQVSKTWTVRIQ